jgi:hypothetical protein
MVFSVERPVLISGTPRRLRHLDLTQTPRSSGAYGRSIRLETTSTRPSLQACSRNRDRQEGRAHCSARGQAPLQRAAAAIPYARRAVGMPCSHHSRTEGRKHRRRTARFGHARRQDPAGPNPRPCVPPSPLRPAPGQGAPNQEAAPDRTEPLGNRMRSSRASRGPQPRHPCIRCIFLSTVSIL